MPLRSLVRAAAPLVLAFALAAQTATPLRDSARKRGIELGSCTSSRLLENPDYTSVVLRDLTQVEPENDMKFGPIHPSRNGYAFERADALAKFAAEKGLRLRGHTLVWHSQNPAWLTGGSFTPAELKEILHDHIKTVVGRYAGQVKAWDVVNEAFNDDGSMRSTIWHDKPGIGLEGAAYIEQAFRWAHEADPAARLFYNDYNTEVVNAKSTAVYNLVKDLLARGVPIAGVGFQFHITQSTDLGGMEANFKRFADLGVDLEITELDVRVPVDASGKASEADLEKQAAQYRTVFSTCLRYKACKAIQMWGITDRYSWIPGVFKGTGAALPYDRDYLPKPAWKAISEALAAPR